MRRIAILALVLTLLSPGTGSTLTETVLGEGVASTTATASGLPVTEEACSYDADGDGTDDLSWHEGRCVALTVQAAIDHAPPGGTVVVPASSLEPPTPRRETLQISTNHEERAFDGLTICSGQAGEGPFDPAPPFIADGPDACRPTPEAAILDARGLQAPLVNITAEARDITLRGFTLRWSLSTDSGQPPAGASEIGTGIRVAGQGSMIQGNVLATVDDTPLGAVEHTRTREARGVGAGILVEPGATRTVLRGNDLSNATVPLELAAGTEDLDVDARLNTWGVPDCSLIPYRVHDTGQSNLVRYIPPIPGLASTGGLGTCLTETVDHRAVFTFRPALVPAEKDDGLQFRFDENSEIQVTATLLGIDGQARSIQERTATLVLMEADPGPGDSPRFETFPATATEGDADAPANATFTLPAERVAGEGWKLWIESEDLEEARLPTAAQPLQYSAFNRTNSSGEEILSPLSTELRERLGSSVDDLLSTGSPDALVQDLSDALAMPVISPGLPERIEIQAPATGDPIEDLDATTDDAIRLQAMGYDADDKIFGPVEVDWTFAPGASLDGTFSPGRGTSTTLDLTRPGNGAVQATAAQPPADLELRDTAGQLDVDPGRIDHLELQDATSGGLLDGQVSKTTDQTLTVQAIGFDADGNRILDEEGQATGITRVDWRTEGGLDAAGCPEASTCEFAPVTANTSGRLIADHDDLVPSIDASVPVEVTAGELASLSLQAQGSEGQSLPIEDHALAVTTDQTVTLTAVGSDADGNELGPRPVAWTLDGPLDGSCPQRTATCTLDPKEVGNTTITTNHAALGPGPGVNVSVGVGALDHILISSQVVGGDGRFQMSTDGSLNLTALAFDADGNPRGEIIANWSLSSDPADPADGTFTPGSGATTTFRPTEPGRAAIVATAAGLTDTTAPIEVTPGSLDAIQVELTDQPGEALGALPDLTTDDGLDLTARGYDADGNLLGPRAVNWSLTVPEGQEAPVGAFSNATGETTALDLTTPGTGQIVASPTDDPAADEGISGVLAVSPGAVANLEIATEEQELGDGPFTTDDALDLTAEGYDADGNLNGTVAATWRLLGDSIGDLSTSTGETTRLELTHPGEATLSATFEDLTAEESLRVEVGALASLHLEDGEQRVLDRQRNISTDDTLEIHAIGKDADGNRIGPQAVAWSPTGGLPDDACPGQSRFCLSPYTAGRSGTIEADHPELADAPDVESPMLHTVAGELDHIRLRMLDDDTGQVLEHSGSGALEVTADNTLTIEAIGYDAADNTLGLQEVHWDVSGNLSGSCPADPATTCTFRPRVAGAEGTIAADHADQEVQGDVTPSIKVTAGALDHIRLFDSAGADASGPRTLSTDDRLAVHAIGFDGDGNRRGPATVNWSLTVPDGQEAPVGAFSNTTGEMTALELATPGTGTIVADHPGLDGTVDATAGTLTITVGALDHVVVEVAASTPADTAIQATARPLDADGNLRDDSITWHVTDGTGSIHPTTGRFTPDRVGHVTVQATAEDAANDTTEQGTGEVRVTVGALDQLILTKAPTNTTADAPVAFHADPRDANGNPREDTVTFEVTDGPGQIDPASGRFTPDAVGTTTLQVTARDTGNETDLTRTTSIETTVGALASMAVLDAPSSLRAGETTNLTIQPVDASGNPRADTLTGCSVVDGFGQAAPAGEHVCRFQALDAGVARLRLTAADTSNRTEVNTTVQVQVTHGPLADLILRQASVTTDADTGIQIEAIPADRTGQARAPFPVTYTLEDGPGSIDPATGLYTPDAAGNATINVTAEDPKNTTKAWAQATIEVTPGAPAALEIEPLDQPLTAGGQAATVHARVLDAHGNTVPLDPAEDIAWRLDDPAGGQFAGDQLTPGDQAGSYLISAAVTQAPEVIDHQRVTLEPGPLASLDLQPHDATILKTRVQAFQAIGLDGNGNHVPVNVSWSVDDPATATISADGLVDPDKVGMVNVTAAVPGSGVSATTPLTIVDRFVPLASLQLTPSEPSIPAGRTTTFTVTGIDDEGARVTGLTPTYEVSNATVGTVDQSGTFTANRVGTTKLTATVDGLEATTTISVVPGALTQLRISPTSVTLDPGQVLEPMAWGLDPRNNRVDLAAGEVTWTAVDPTAVTVDETGAIQAAEDAAGTTTVVASLGDLDRLLTVHVTEAAAADGQALNLTSSLTESTVTAAADPGDTGPDANASDPVVIKSYSVGLSKVEAGAEVQIHPPANVTAGTEEATGAGSPERFQGARAKLGSDANRVAIDVDIQDGHPDLAPDEVDVADVQQIVRDRTDGNEGPALFLSVRASEDGRELNSTRLNQLVDTLGVDLRIEASYFEVNDLDPRRVGLIEYSEGQRVRDDLDVTLLDDAPFEGAYNYTVTLHEFSAFAAVGEPVVIGGGGGSVAPRGATQPATTTRVPFDAGTVGTVRFSQDLPAPLTAASLHLEEACTGCHLVVDTSPSQPAGLPAKLEIVDRFDVEIVPGKDAPTPALAGATLTLGLPTDTLTLGLPTDTLTDAQARQVVLLHHDGERWRNEPLQHLGKTGGLHRFTADLAALSPFALALDLQGPRIDDPRPAGQVDTTTTTLAATWSDNVAVDPSTATLVLDGQTLGESDGAIMASPDGFNLVLHTAIAPGRHTAHLSVADHAGHETNRTWTFEVTCSSPEIQSMSPSNGATDVPVGTALEIQLSLDACPVTDATLNLGGSTLGLSGGDGTLTAQAPEGIGPGDKVEATLSIEDSQGQAIETAWRFTMADDPLSSTGEPDAHADQGPRLPAAAVIPLAVVVALALSGMLGALLQVAAFSLRRED